MVTVRIKNNAPGTWQPHPDAESYTRLILEGMLTPETVLQLRSNYGWDCEYADLKYPVSFDRRGRMFCRLEHAIAPGQFSLPLEVEALPLDTVNLSTPLAVTGQFITPVTPYLIPNTTEDGTTPTSNMTELTWNASGGSEAAPGADVAASSSATDPATQEATVGLTAQSAGAISTGAFSFNGAIANSQWAGPGFMVNPGLEITIPTDKVELLSLTGFAPVDRGSVTVPPILTGSTSRSFSDRALDGSSYADERQLVLNEDYFLDPATGRYVVNFPGNSRFLPGRPWRFVAKVRLKAGVDAATLSVDADAPQDVNFGDTGRSGRAGRAVFTGAYSDTASTTVTRAVVPDSGGVQNQTQAPLLTGKARFGDEEITVGKRTTLRVTVTNSGNAPSTAPRVCVRISSHLVVIKVPKGVTVKGSLLCAPLPTIAAGQTVTAAKGIVLRGVRATDKAKVRDGAQEGIPVSGDDLRIVAGQIRAGGVTG